MRLRRPAFFLFLNDFCLIYRGPSFPRGPFVMKKKKLGPWVSEKMQREWHPSAQTAWDRVLEQHLRQCGLLERYTSEEMHQTRASLNHIYRLHPFVVAVAERIGRFWGSVRDRPSFSVVEMLVVDLDVSLRNAFLRRMEDLLVGFKLPKPPFTVQCGGEWRDSIAMWDGSSTPRRRSFDGSMSFWG